MPSKAKPIQMKTTYHVGGSVPIAPKGVKNIGLKKAIGRPKPPKAPIRKMPIERRVPPQQLGLKKAIGRPKPPKAPIRKMPIERRVPPQQYGPAAKARSGSPKAPARNMAVTGPKRRTGWGGRRMFRNLSRFR